VTDPILHAPVESPGEDPRLAMRRRKVKLDALRRKRAAEPIQSPNRLQTLIDELRWRWQLRRSLSGRMMTATAWVIALLLISISALAVIVAVNIY
jgi:hypothetical protein